MGHFFGRVSCLFHVLGQLCFFGRDVSCRKSFSWALSVPKETVSTLEPKELEEPELRMAWG